MYRALKPVLLVVAAVYLAADELFSIVTHPLARWLAKLPAFWKIRDWISSLRPYPALALFAVPLIILEPVKPAAAYLAATGHLVGATLVFVFGEVLKLVLVERLFHLNKDKLLSIPPFAWCYARVRAVWDFLESSLVWRNVKRKILALQLVLRDFIAQQMTSERDHTASVDRHSHPRRRARA